MRGTFMKNLALLMLVICGTGFRSLMAAVQTEVVEYKHGDIVLEGFLAYDDAGPKKKPGLLIVHEWTGLGDYVKERARQMAALGYTAFAVDIYGKGIRPQGMEDAGKEATKYKSNRKLMRERVLAGLKAMKATGRVDASKIGAFGYCFGGTTVLELARSGAPLKAVVSFHGGLDSPNPRDAQKIKGRVLVLHGADDPLVPDAEVAAFQKEMREARVDWTMISYGGAVHSFSNPAAGNDPKKGFAYNKRADQRSFEDMKRFFESELQ